MGRLANVAEKKYKFQKKYAVWGLLLLFTEILIAFFAHDRIIRPYVGDYLVVMLMYCSVKSFADLSVTFTLIGVLLFSYLIEILQYMNIVSVLGLQDSRVMSTVIGTSFEWIDILAYTLGAISIFILEKKTSYSLFKQLKTWSIL